MSIVETQETLTFFAWQNPAGFIFTDMHSFYCENAKKKKKSVWKYYMFF